MIRSWIRTIRIAGRTHNLPHPFEDEVEWLVRTNHDLVLRGVDEIVAKVPPEDRDPDYTDELRESATRMALVALVTRLHHWIAELSADGTNINAAEKSLVSNMKRLNQRTGPAPVPLEFFENLVTVRDSIIHADSRDEWTYQRKNRRVADRYANRSFGEIEFTKEHLQEAIESAQKQVKWYHEMLLDGHARKGSANS